MDNLGVIGLLPFLSVRSKDIFQQTFYAGSLDYLKGNYPRWAAPDSPSDMLNGHACFLSRRMDMPVPFYWILYEKQPLFL